MQAGLGHLRLPPDAFWRMTPRELAAALGLSGHRAGACDGETLRALMRRFPDC